MKFNNKINYSSSQLSTTLNPPNLFFEKEPIYLKILDIFESVFRRAKIDYQTLRLLVKVKMELNKRALISPFGQKQRQENRRKQSSMINFIIQIMMGTMISMVMMVPANLFYLYLIVISPFFIIIISGTVPQLAQIFLSEEDLEVLPVRPISPKLINWSKAIQVIIYQSTNLIAYGIPMFVFSLIAKGPIVAIVAFLMFILLTAFGLLLSFSLYLFMAKHFSTEKLKDFIAYIQILTSVVFIVAYQFIGQSMQFLQSLTLDFSPLFFLYPLSWFAAPFLYWEKEPLWASIGLIIVFAVLFFLSIYYLKNNAQFEEKIEIAIRNKSTQKKNYWYSRLSGKLLCNRGEEKAMFQFISRMFVNERTFKISVYPSIAIYTLFPYIMYFISFRHAIEDFDFIDIDAFPTHVIAYGTYILIPFILKFIEMSDYYQGAWIFSVNPHDLDPAIATALAKNIWSKYFLILAIPQAVFWYFMTGVNGALSMIIVILHAYLLINFTIQKMNMYRPFSRKRANIEGEGCGTFVIFSLISTVYSAIHFAVEMRFKTAGLVIYAILLLIVFIFTIRIYKGKKKFLTWQ